MRGRGDPRRLLQTDRQNVVPGRAGGGLKLRQVLWQMSGASGMYSGSFSEHSMSCNASQSVGSLTMLTT